MDWTSVHLSPLLPLPLVIGLASAAIVLMAYSVFRGARRGIILRLLFTLSLALTLLNPQIVAREQEPVADEVLLVVDNSSSQSLEQRPEHSAEAIAAIEAALGQATDVELTTVRTRQGTGSDTETRLFAPLTATLADIPEERLGGVIVVTDGLVHDTAEAVGLAAPNAPVHVLLTGTQAAPDRRIVLEQTPEFALVERAVGLVARVVDTNMTGADGRARLVVRLDGKPVFDEQIPVNTPWPVMVMPERPGPMTIEVETPPAIGELFLENNLAVMQLNAVRDRLRVLMVSGEPHPGERVWRSVLRSDPAIDLIHFTILRLPTSFDLTTTQELALIQFPVQELFENQLENFDLVIFDRYRLMGVLPMFYLKLLADYVDLGGAFLLASGPEFASPFNLYSTPLSQILPAAPTGRIIETPYRPALTALGRRHPVSAGLAGGGDEPDWGSWFRLVDGVAVDGDVLLSGPGDRPALVLARMGDGRVAQLLSDQIWMWSRGLEGGGPHRELLRRTVHWLVREPDLEEESLAARGDGMDIAVERRSLSSEGGLVSLTGPDGETATVELQGLGGGLSRGEISVETPGLYKISDGIRQVLAAAGPLNTPETREFVPTGDRMAALAEETGGGMFWIEEGVPSLRRVSEGSRAFGAGWMGLERRNAARTLQLRQIPLLPPTLALFLLIALGLAMWWRESR